MAAPKFVPADVTSRAVAYASPDHVPAAWAPERPGELVGPQPQGERLGYQGPDQGYALLLANRMRDRVKLGAGESFADVVGGCLGIALRRASLFGRGPVGHDVSIALMIWGFLDDNAPKELREARTHRFEGAANPHHYVETRALADMVPEATLRHSYAEVAALYPANWRQLTGVA